MTDAAFGAKLHIFTSDLSEGFFGKKVVLVEGRSDKALLEAALTLKERTATSEGLTIIPVGGKTVLDKPAFIFQTLKIPTYVIFDNDQKTKEKEKPAEIIYNRFLQRLLGVPEQEIVDWPVGVHERWAAWDGDIEAYIRTTCGDPLYEAAKTEMMANFEVSGDDCVKSPVVAAAMLTKFAAQKIVFADIDKVIEMVDALQS